MAYGFEVLRALLKTCYLAWLRRAEEILASRHGSWYTVSKEYVVGKPRQLPGGLPVSEQGLPRGNNSVESWHSRFSKVVGASHPGVRRFISRLKQEQQLQTTDWKALLRRQQPPRQRKGVLAREAAIERISNNRRDMPMKDLLRAIASSTETVDCVVGHFKTRGTMQ
ncbi:hypothetical protein HPB48_005725 [Haemaphysalis longicornis]|uniref:Uncharacterized protein n=1 Tax=Haemaphysalis longicornis TaxID=44386 RepID=A0A9J6FD49_HAELO|nr:hypothetical protein HPB48_005725 [Haemaphysalis longicornis]